ncbi:MAG: hypothetical protein IIX54_03350 [Clostridia bacterium]|nr:hypothetical protein [Clostridia bacterium]
MLNEKKEYELYLTEGYGKLITRENIKNGLAGLRHILTVLTRGFLELLDSEGITSTEQKDTLCQEFLFCWLTEEYTLPKYATIKMKKEFSKAKEASLLKHIVANEIKVDGFGGADADTVKKGLNKKVNSWKSSMFFSLSENSVNEIKFRAIIADALLLGPLTDQKIVIRNDIPFYAIECERKHIAYIDTFLAIVGESLKRVRPGMTGAVVKMCELANYIDKPANHKNARSAELYSVDGFFAGHLTYKGEAILRKEVVTGGVVKVFFNQNWLADLGVRLAPASEKISAPFTAFSDFDLLKDRFL